MGAAKAALRDSGLNVAGSNAMDAVILCGGQSRRMGQNKAFLPVNGKPLIEVQIEALRRVFERILLVTRAPREYEHLAKDASAAGGQAVEIVEDAIAGGGAMVGIYSGLLAVRGRAGFFVACDVPFLSEGLIRFMIGLSVKEDVVIPKSPQGLEPTHAVYSKACLAPMEKQMLKGDFKIISFFPQVAVRVVSDAEVRQHDPMGLALVNINTQDEYKQYSAALLKRQGATK
jgi:molybdopterin-guanine dinucleotide biosynthesis protein A